MKAKPISQLVNGINATSTQVPSQMTNGADADRKRDIANKMRQKVASAYQNGQGLAKPMIENTTQIRPPSPQKLEQAQPEQKICPPRHQAKKPISPMETYEMSDRGESDSEESDYEEKEPKKKVCLLSSRFSTYLLLLFHAKVKISTYSVESDSDLGTKRVFETCT